MYIKKLSDCVLVTLNYKSFYSHSKKMCLFSQIVLF